MSTHTHTGGVLCRFIYLCVYAYVEIKIMHARFPMSVYYVCACGFPFGFVKKDVFFLFPLLLDYSTHPLAYRYQKYSICSWIFSGLYASPPLSIAPVFHISFLLILFEFSICQFTETNFFARASQKWWFSPHSSINSNGKSIDPEKYNKKENFFFSKTLLYCIICSSV